MGKVRLVRRAIKSPPDTGLGVIHRRGKRAIQLAQPEAVNNYAAGYSVGGYAAALPAELKYFTLCHFEGIPEEGEFTNFFA